MDTIRIAERLSEGGIFTEEQARRMHLGGTDENGNTTSGVDQLLTDPFYRTQQSSQMLAANARSTEDRQDTQNRPLRFRERGKRLYLRLFGCRSR